MEQYIFRQVTAIRINLYKESNAAALGIKLQVVMRDTPRDSVLVLNIEVFQIKFEKLSKKKKKYKK